MSALDNILEDHIINTHDGSSDYLACCGGVVEFGERHHTETCGLIEARAELAELRDTITHDKAMLANDGIVLLECLKLLGLDVSGADTHDIPKAIEAMKVRLERLETVATDVNEWMIRCNMGGTAHQRSLEAALQKGE